MTELKLQLATSGMSKKRWYNEIYLKSPHWKLLRAKKINSVGRKCEKCGSFHEIQVHHLKYRSIFDVELADLQVLCGDCHRGEHKKKPRNRRVSRSRLSPEERFDRRCRRIKAGKVRNLFPKYLQS